MKNNLSALDLLTVEEPEARAGLEAPTSIVNCYDTIINDLNNFRPQNTLETLNVETPQRHDVRRRWNSGRR